MFVFFTVFIDFENKHILFSETYFAAIVLYYVELSSSDACYLGKPDS